MLDPAHFSDLLGVRAETNRRSEPVAYPGILLGGGVQQIQLRTEDRENGDLGAVAPSQGFWRQL